ncbi:hypothetical protein [Anaeromicropila herbilytica]|uniref:Uncharacterized protein n=1 Tax=Anaeromicropila herbilytica TaxID=2785025 RepID=A0A7R7IG04_9FIRM|nr:hypothetical protein [Anaeromicropila herbilytica]BCN32588.1 hypothetical protein bsdtb5_38830 [Anaeromicropila herbilytica]
MKKPQKSLFKRKKIYVSFTLTIILTLALGLNGCTTSKLLEHKSNAKTVQHKPNTYIPKGLLDQLSNAILTNKGKEYLKDKVTGKKLSDKELSRYTTDKTVAEYKKQLDESDGYVEGYVMQVDADNDGIQDLFFLIPSGGTAGYNSRILLKGKKDGSYKMTSDKIETTQELEFIKYKNKNYLIETSFSYDFKRDDGYIVLCFKDGQIYEKAKLTLKADGYDVTTSTSKDKYKKLASEATKIARNYDINNIDNNIIKGDAETALKEEDYQTYEKDLHCQEYHWFQSDIDNDGVDEIYTKGIFYTSTIGTLTGLQDALITNNLSESEPYPDLISYYNIEIGEVTPEMFWISKVDKENIFNLITYRNVTDFAVSGYLIKGKKVSKVYEVYFKGKQKVAREIYTRGKNYKDDEKGFE